MRSKAHIHETIATKAFERALSPQLVANPVNQGKDYGIDYRVQVFDQRGELTGGFDVQVKYVPLDTESIETNVFPYYNALDTQEPTTVAFSISNSHLSQYLDVKVSPQDTLFVLANEKHLFYLWISDLYEFYLRWLPEPKQESRTIYFCDVRSFKKRITALKWACPQRPEYSAGKDGFLLHNVWSCGDGWLSHEIGPRSVDSLTNLGACMFLQNSCVRRRITDDFDSEGFFTMLLNEEKEREWIWLVFANFIGLVTPTSAMINWAVAQLKAKQNGFAIPAAFQILANAKNPEMFEAVMSWMNQFTTPGQELLYYERLFVNTKYDPRVRFLTDFLLAKAHYFKTQLLRAQNDQLQECLWQNFYNFDYSWDEGNMFVETIIELIERGQMRSGPCWQRLLKVLKMEETVANGTVIEGIRQLNRDWHFESLEK